MIISCSHAHSSNVISGVFFKCHLRIKYLCPTCSFILVDKDLSCSHTYFFKHLHCCPTVILNRYCVLFCDTYSKIGTVQLHVYKQQYLYLYRVKYNKCHKKTSNFNFYDSYINV